MAPILERWGEMADTLRGVWPSVVYINVRERRGSDLSHAFRINPRGPEDEEPCPLITQRYIDEYGTETDEAGAWRNLDDPTLLDLTLATLKHEIHEQVWGSDDEHRYKIEFYTHKGTGVGGRTIVVQPPEKTPTRPPTTPALDPEQARREWMGGIDEVDDPGARIVMAGNAALVANFERMELNYQNLFDVLHGSYERLHGVFTGVLGEVEKTNRTRYRHVEAMKTGQLRELEAALQARRLELDARAGESTGENDAADIAVKQAAVDRFAGLGEKLLGAFLAGQGIAPELAPLLDMLDQHPQLRAALPKLAKVKDNPALMQGLVEVLEELSDLTDLEDTPDSAAPPPEASP